MWTPATRKKHSRKMPRYQSDLTDEEWCVIEPHLPATNVTGRPRVWPMREIINGIFYVMRAGCPWRLLPSDLPPWSTIYRWFAKFRDEGRFERINHALVMLDGERIGRQSSPTGAIIDTQSAKTTEAGGPRGYDAGKKINGRKRHALVDTDGRGIGLAAASALADAGAHVTLAARTATEIAEAANAIRARGQQADPLTLDVRDVEAVKTTIAAQEPFDILVNNAGTNRPAPFVDVNVEDFDFVFGLNVRAAYFLAQAVARRLIDAKKSGSIINMSSQMGHVGGPTRTVYCATKHAIEGFTKAMAIELAPHKIRVNTLAPTFIETPMTRPFFQNEAFRTDTLNRIKLGRLGQLEDLTGAIVFLASDAAALMTGTSLVIDGGWTAE